MEHTAKFGSYLVIPLKYEDADVPERITARFAPCAMTTMDLNENVKAMLQPGSTSVGSCCPLSRTLLEQTLAAEGGTLQVSGQPFSLHDAFLYVFHTKVAFLCLGITYDSMDTLRTICNPGYAESYAVYTLRRGDTQQEIPFLQRLEDFCASLGLLRFFDSGSLLLEAHVLTLGLVSQYLPSLEELRRVTFRLHQMLPLEREMDDDSEGDIRYVYAVKNQEKQAYRWGCCVACNNTSYVVADPDMDLPAELAAQSADSLPIVVLAMYEKYTCLRFGQLIARRETRPIKKLRQLKKLMLEFRAFGTVAPANLSRWHNVRQIYASLLEVHDIPAAVEDISTKLSILNDEQQELESERSQRLVNIITIFGIVSILASVLSIIQILAGGDMIFWISTAVTAVGLALVLALAVRIRK